jgi:APA family basic amino acid/polyamine antiporter
LLLVSAGVIVSRRAGPDLPRGFRTPLVPLLPSASMCACLGLMVNLTVVTFVTWVRFGVWMDVGTRCWPGERLPRRHS